MKKVKFTAWLGLTAAGLLAMAAAGPPPTTVVLIGHDKVTEAFAKGGVMLETTDYKVQAGHREAPGTVEIHDHDTDIFYVLEGTGTLVTGGKATETTTVSSGEIRGKEITGGETRELVKGDVVIIPKGVPHWFKEAKGPLLYYVVKVTK